MFKTIFRGECEGNAHCRPASNQEGLSGLFPFSPNLLYGHLSSCTWLSFVS
jgi:hypothetical protein